MAEGGMDWEKRLSEKRVASRQFFVLWLNFVSSSFCFIPVRQKTTVSCAAAEVSGSGPAGTSPTSTSSRYDPAFFLSPHPRSFAARLIAFASSLGRRIRTNSQMGKGPPTDARSSRLVYYLPSRELLVSIVGSGRSGVSASVASEII